MLSLTLNVDPSLGPFDVPASLVKYLKCLMLMFGLQGWGGGRS